MNELAQTLSTLGDDALYAFIVFQVLNAIEVLTLLSLVTWGTRTVWKVVKKQIEDN